MFFSLFFKCVFPFWWPWAFYHLLCKVAIFCLLSLLKHTLLHLGKKEVLISDLPPLHLFGDLTEIKELSNQASQHQAHLSVPASCIRTWRKVERWRKQCPVLNHLNPQKKMGTAALTFQDLSTASPRPRPIHRLVHIPRERLPAKSTWVYMHLFWKGIQYDPMTSKNQWNKETNKSNDTTQTN